MSRAKLPGLLRGMAEHIGATLPAKDEPQHDLAQLCDACSVHDRCILWMVETPHAEAAPDYCLNRERLGQLQG